MPTEDPAMPDVGVPASPPLTRSVCLHVVSPGPENRHTFANLPLSTTVGELKALIANSAPGRPEPSRQRLIYCGKRLSNDPDTLESVLGPVEPANGNSTFTIHLVPPPLVPSNPFESPTRDPHPPAVPLGQNTHVGQPHQLQGPASQILNQGPIPLPVYPTPHEQRPVPLEPQAPPLPQLPQHPGLQSFQNAQRMMTQNPHFGRLEGMQGLINQLAANLPLQPQHQGQQPGGAQNNSSSPPSNSFTSQNTIHQEGQGTNGEGYQITVRRSTSSTITTTTTTRTTSSLPSGRSRNVPSPDQSAANLGNVSNNSPLGLPQNQVYVNRDLLPPFAQVSLPLQYLLATLETSIANGPSLPQGDVNLMYRHFNEAVRNSNVRATDPLYLDIRFRMANLTAMHINALRREAEMRSVTIPVVQDNHHPPASNNSTLVQSGSNLVTNISTIVNNSVPVTGEALAANTSTIYLLSSPNGPHAIVFPSGVAYTMASPPSASTGASEGNRGPNITALIVQQEEWARRELMGPPVDPGLLRQVRRIRQRRIQFSANLAAIWRSVWLLARLVFFVWIFGRGGTWTQTLLLTFGSFLILLAHAGVFGPLQEYWNPIRQHLEGLLPLAPNGAPNQRADPAAVQGEAAAAARLAREPDPQEVADRLLRERREHGDTWIREHLRRVERAVALFVASLVPGVGERHIEARNAADAARLIEQREREERARQEQAANEGGAGQLSGNGDQASADRHAGGSDSNSSGRVGQRD